MNRKFLYIALAASCASAWGGYHVVNKIAIGGAGSWDYVTADSAGRRLYVSHGNVTVVVDLDSGQKVGEIADTTGVHGIAIAPELNRGFTSNGRANNATIFDLKTLAKIGVVATGQNPDAIQYDSASKRVFTFNGRSNDATAFDAATGKVEATIPLGGKPEFSQADGKGQIFVNIEPSHEIVVLDSKALKIIKRYALEGCEEPSGLAFDAKRRRLFSVCGNKVMAISDPDTGKLVQTLPIGDGADGAGFDAGRGVAFSSNGEGNLTVVKLTGAKYAVAETVPTQQGARTMAVDEKTHKVYLPSAQFGKPPAEGKRAPIVPGTFELLVVGE